MMRARRARGGPAAVAVLLCAVASGCAVAVDPAAIADAQTAARVKTVLVNDPDVGGRAIEVHVEHGVVTLSGRVQSQGEADRAVELARTVQGVADVRANLLVGVVELPPAAPQSQDATPVEDVELRSEANLLSIGAAIGWSGPREENLQTRTSIGPIVRLGSRRGLGPAIGFDWYHADVQSLRGGPQILSRVHVRPLMIGVGYTLALGRASIAPSLVGGVAFNSITVTDTGAAAGVPVGVENSPVWRAGVASWFNVSRRVALNLSAGYLMTRLPLIVFEGGRLEKQRVRGDTIVARVGLAYRLF